MDNEDLASIVFTVYNQERYVGDALASALNQSYEPLEIVVSDDGSVDGTRKSIDLAIGEAGFRFIAENDGVRVFRKNAKTVLVNFNAKNMGICANYEYAFGLTHGGLVFTFGGDDISQPNRVEKVMAHWIAGGRKATVLASGGWLMTVDGKVYRDYGREVMNGAPVGAFNAYKRCVFDDFPRIDPDLAALTYEDSIYGLRAQFFSPAEYVDAQLVRYRFGSGVSTGGAWRRKAIRNAKAIEASCKQLIVDLDCMRRKLAPETYNRKRQDFINSIAHEQNYLLVLDGKTFAVRLAAFLRHGYLVSGPKHLLIGLTLLLPPDLSDRILSLLQSRRQ